MAVTIEMKIGDVYDVELAEKLANHHYRRMVDLMNQSEVDRTEVLFLLDEMDKLTRELIEEVKRARK